MVENIVILGKSARSGKKEAGFGEWTPDTILSKSVPGGAKGRRERCWGCRPDDDCCCRKTSRLFKGSYIPRRVDPSVPLLLSQSPCPNHPYFLAFLTLRLEASPFRLGIHNGLGLAK